MAVTNTVRAVNLASVTSASIPFSFGLLGTLSNPCFLVRIVNNSDADITISYDGTIPHDFVPIGETLVVNAQTNSQPNNFITNFRSGLNIYLRGTAGTTGSVYLAGYYSPRSTV